MAELGVDAIAALAPNFFRPASVEQLLDYCERIASEGESTPFFFYDIPAMTGVRLSMPEFLAEAQQRLPTLCGLKYTNDDLVQLQECLQVAPDRYRILFGLDECLLAGLALGVHGAVGSSYNFAAPLYLQLISAWESGDLPRARALQLRSVRLIRCLERFGYLAAAKATMQLVGVDCGPVRATAEPTHPPTIHRAAPGAGAAGLALAI